MPTGHLHVEPWGPNGPARGWAMIACDPGWFDASMALGQRHIPGTWRVVVDAERQDRHARLALVPEIVERGRWGPHVSVTRGEQPQRNADVWAFRVACTQTSQRLVHLRNVRAEMEAKQANIEHSIKSMGPDVKAKFRVRVEEPLVQVLRDLGRIRGQIGEAERHFQHALKAWGRVSARVPETLQPDYEAVFTLAGGLQAEARHWWYPVRCDVLVEIRDYFGLRAIKMQPHLTVAVAPERGEARRGRGSGSV